MKRYERVTYEMRRRLWREQCDEYVRVHGDPLDRAMEKVFEDLMLESTHAEPCTRLQDEHS